MPNDIDMTQRIALVTGANRGIGLETARQLARRGFYVVVAEAPRELTGKMFRDRREVTW